MNQSGKRDSWASRAGFVLACIGSAVGMGNIWLFPSRVSAYGGATFLIPYLIFVALIGSTGVIGEMAFGRATRSGPIHAFGQATKRRCRSERPGRALGFIPVLGSLAMAIGYSVVVGWIFNYLAASFTGGLNGLADVGAFSARFDATAAGNAPWQIAGMLITLTIMALGVGGGIEKANKLMMPLFFVLFLGLAVYLAFLPGSAAGYRYIFILDPKGLADPMVWVYALGQAFFSLSIAGNGTLIYGSYLSAAGSGIRHTGGSGCRAGHHSRHGAGRAGADPERPRPDVHLSAQRTARHSRRRHHSDGVLYRRDVCGAHLPHQPV